MPQWGTAPRRYSPPVQAQPPPTPVRTLPNGLILAARHHHLTPHLLDLRNSGDTAGPRDQVVGYASFAFTGEASHDH